MEVVIVGAGAAGLNAARVLHEHGIRTVIYEASERVGGRIRTCDDAWHARLPVELGPEYVHGDPAELRRNAAAKLVIDEIADRHHRRCGERLVEETDVWGTLDRLLDAAPPPERDESAAAYRARRGMSEADAELFTQLVEGFYNAPLDDISVASVAADKSAGGAASQARVRGGYAIVVGKLLREVPIYLRHPVRMIDWSARDVVVQLEDGRRVVAPYVIVTVPIGVLHAGTIAFTPALPREHTDALAKLGMGTVTKVVTCMREPIWKRIEPSLSFLHGHGAFPVFWMRSHGGAHQVTAWVGGPRARDVEAPQAIEELADALGMPFEDIASAVEHQHVHDYNDDPWSLGAYSYARVGGVGTPHVLATPIGARLLLAGEATDAEYQGTVTGALASGARAAHQVLRAMRGVRARERSVAAIAR